MNKPELVLSNTTSFFSGNIETLFKNAKKYGFKYVEIIPYRWVNPQQIVHLTKQYGVKVAGIHMPVWWGKTVWQHIVREKRTLDKLFSLVWNFYLGDAKASPALAVAEALSENQPYVLFHTPVVRDMGGEFDRIARRFHTVIENIPYCSGHEEFLWNPEIIKNLSPVVFDMGHFDQSRKVLPRIDLIKIYNATRPEVIHISYNSHGIHLLPDEKEQNELKALLKIHSPRYITIETNPAVSIKKGKLLLEKILAETSQLRSASLEE